MSLAYVSATWSYRFSQSICCLILFFYFCSGPAKHTRQTHCTSVHSTHSHTLQCTGNSIRATHTTTRDCTWISVEYFGISGFPVPKIRPNLLCHILHWFRHPVHQVMVPKHPSNVHKTSKTWAGGARVKQNNKNKIKKWFEKFLENPRFPSYASNF